MSLREVLPRSAARLVLGEPRAPCSTWRSEAVYYAQLDVEPRQARYRAMASAAGDSGHAGAGAAV
jgi:hypothetical protein